MTGYDALAAEYYDSVQHPTCANFREASRALIEMMVPAGARECCEVGAGDSLFAEVAVSRHGDAERLLLTDASFAMLEYSRRWQRHGAQLTVACASDLPVQDRSLQLVVASLGDPYDKDKFWREVARVLVPVGCCLLTTPSWEWAQRYRRGGARIDLAEFELADGRTVTAPSSIRHPTDERALIERHGLSVVREASVPLKEIRGPVSRKLGMLDPADPVVIGYLVTRGR
jgi:SAM-dependent methyltransferase